MEELLAMMFASFRRAIVPLMSLVSRIIRSRGYVLELQPVRLLPNEVLPSFCCMNMHYLVEDALFIPAFKWNMLVSRLMTVPYELEDANI